MNEKRIQLRRIKGWKKPENTVVVSRPTKYGNPFHGAFTRKRAVELFEGSHALKHLIASGAVDELRGKNLACWCPLDGPCHADILLRVANCGELGLP